MMDIVIEKNTKDYYEIFVNNQFIKVDILSCTMREAIISFCNDISQGCSNLLKPRNSCKKCEEPRGYDRYATSDDEFYCSNCENKLELMSEKYNNNKPN